MVEPFDPAPGGGKRAIPPDGLGAGSGQAAQEQVPGGPESARPVDAVLRDPLAEPYQRIALDVIAHHRVPEDSLGVRLGDRRALANIDGAGGGIDGLHLPKGLPTVVAKLVPRADLALLRRKPVAIDDTSADRADAAGEFQAAQPSLFLQELLRRQGAQPEILPPGRLLLAAMPVEEVGQQPTRLLLRVPFAGIGRDIARQPAVQLHDALLVLVDGLARRALLEGRPRDRLPLRTRLSRSCSSQSRSPIAETQSSRL